MIDTLPADVRAICERFGYTDFDDEGPVVDRSNLLEFARALKDEGGFLFFVYCAAAHFPEEGTQGEEGYLPDRTLVAYRVRRMPAPGQPMIDLPFRVWVPTGETTQSLVPIWAGADWQEREQYDLVGTVFSGHPDLRRIMMPEDWPGHPLRRDYAIDTRHFPWR